MKMTVTDVCTLLQNVPNVREMLEGSENDIADPDRFKNFCCWNNLPFGMFIEEDGEPMLWEFLKMSRHIIKNGQCTIARKAKLGNEDTVIIGKMERIFKKYMKPLDLRRTLLYDTNSQQATLLRSLSNETHIFSACNFIADTHSNRSLTIIFDSDDREFVDRKMITISNHQYEEGMVWINSGTSKQQLSPVDATTEVLEFVQNSLVRSQPDRYSYPFFVIDFNTQDEWTHSSHELSIKIHSWGPDSEDVYADDHPDVRVMLKCLGFLKADERTSSQEDVRQRRSELGSAKPVAWR